MGIVNGLLFPIFDFVAKNRWAQIVLGLGIFWLIFMAYLAMRDNGVRKVERERQRVENEKERARIVETVTQIGQETEDAKDRALDAPNHIDDVSSADELRDRYPANAEVILRPREAGSGKGPR